MTFDDARYKKFKAGAKEHADQDWETLDVVEEVKGELLDIYNYCEHDSISHELWAILLRHIAKWLWHRL